MASDASSVSPDSPWASGESSVSPDSFGARAPAPLHPIPRHSTRLPTRGAHTHDVTGAVTPISQQGMVATIPTTLITAALPLSLYNLTSFTVVYCHTVEEEWGKINQHHYLLSSRTLTGQAAVSPIRPPRLQQGSVTLHRSSHAVSHTSRTRWASFFRVGTVASPFDRGNLQSLM